MKLPYRHIFANLKRFATFLLKVLTNIEQCLTSKVHHNIKSTPSSFQVHVDIIMSMKD